MKKLIIVAPHFPEYSIRYAASVKEFFATTLIVEQHQYAAEMAGRKNQKGMQIHPRAENFDTLKGCARIVAAVIHARPDVVHLQEAVGRKKSVLNFLIVILMRPFALVALTIHDPAPHTGADGKRGSRFAHVKRLTRQLAHLRIVHGQFCCDLLKETSSHGSESIITSTHGALLDDFKHKQIVFPDNLRMLIFGRMEAYKGIETLLAAARLLADQHVNCELKIIGQGPELDRLLPEFERLENVIVKNAFIEPDELMSCLSEAECVVLPYLEATQSGVAAAALGNGRYVIASAVGGIGDVVKHKQNGLLVEPGNAAEIANAVKTLVGDKAERVRLSEGAWDTAERELDWNRIAKSLSLVFIEALKASDRNKKKQVRG